MQSKGFALRKANLAIYICKGHRIRKRIVAATTLNQHPRRIAAYSFTAKIKCRPNPNHRWDTVLSAQQRSAQLSTQGVQESIKWRVNNMSKLLLGLHDSSHAPCVPLLTSLCRHPVLNDVQSTTASGIGPESLLCCKDTRLGCAPEGKGRHRKGGEGQVHS